MTTVKADGEVAPYEDMENATLLQKECYDLDEDTMIEITTYEKSIPSFARSSWKTKTGTRTYRIINKKSTGIGLYLCQKLCNKLGLGIELNSKRDIGTEVRIIFPKSSYINL